MRTLLLTLLMMAFQASFASEGSDGKAVSNYVPMDAFIVNLKNDAYISFSPELKLTHPEDLEYVKAYVPVFRHEFIKQMMGQDAAAVRTPAFINHFAETALEIANKIVGTGYVKAVFFTNWVVQ